jgi:hypothetical protein
MLSSRVMETTTYYISNKGSYSEFCEEIQDYLPKAYKILVNDRIYNGEISHLYNLEADTKISIFMYKWTVVIYYSHWQQIITVDYLEA